MNQKKSALSVLLAGILWGLITIFIKRLSASGLDAMNISLIRMAVAFPLFTAFVAVRDRSRLRIAPRDIPIFIGTGIVSVVLFNCLYFYTMIHSQASIAVVLLYTSPAFIMIMSALFFKEKITVKKGISLILTAVGCVLVSGIACGGSAITPLILMTGLGSGLCYGLYSIFGRFALKKYDTLTVTEYTFLFGLLGSLAIGRPAQTLSVIISQPGLIPWCIGIGVVCTVLPYLFYTLGLKGLDTGKAGIIAAIEPLVGSLLGMFVYSEPRTPSKIAGTCLILSAIIILNLRERRAKRESAEAIKQKNEA